MKYHLTTQKHSTRRKIDQNKIEYKNKSNFFIKAMEEKNEKEKTNETLKNEKEQKKKRVI